MIALQGTPGGFFATIGQAREAGMLDGLGFRFSISATNVFWASLIGGTDMWTRYFCFDQAQVQRVLTSRSMKGVKTSFLASAIIMNVVYFAMLFVGLVLWLFYDGQAFESSNQVMIGFILENLPVGIVGLVIAGAFAAAMSSVDSLLNSLTTVFVKNIYEEYISKSEEEASLRTTMTIAAVFGVVVIFIVILGFGGTVESVLNVVGRYISYFAGPALGTFLLAMFTLKANDKGTAIGFVTGFLAGFWIAQTFQVSWLWNPAIGCTLTLIIGMLASILFKDNSKDIEEIREFTAIGMRKKIISDGLPQEEDGVSILPFQMDKYAIAALVFFFSQYIVLLLIR